MRRNEKEGNYYRNPTLFYFAPLVLSMALLTLICSDKKSVSPVPSERPVPQPTPDLLSFREGAQCQELMRDIEDVYNKSGLAVYDGKYLLRVNPLDGTALRVMVLTSREKFEHDVRNFDSKLRKELLRTDVEYFPVRYYRVAKKVEGGGAIVDESLESITIGERGIAPGCFFSPTPSASTAASSSR